MTSKRHRKEMCHGLPAKVVWTMKQLWYEGLTTAVTNPDNPRRHRDYSMNYNYEGEGFAWTKSNNNKNWWLLLWASAFTRVQEDACSYSLIK